MCQTAVVCDYLGCYDQNGRSKFIESYNKMYVLKCCKSFFLRDNSINYFAYDCALFFPGYTEWYREGGMCSTCGEFNGKVHCWGMSCKLSCTDYQLFSSFTLLMYCNLRTNHPDTYHWLYCWSPKYLGIKEVATSYFFDDISRIWFFFWGSV